MIVKVKGENDRPIRTAGNPIKMSTVSEVDPQDPIKSPALNEHREKILDELMANSGAYAPTTKGTTDADDELESSENYRTLSNQ
jgi:CoA:oxalate CoA-transferase